MGEDKRDQSTPDIESFITEDGILSSILSSLPLREAARTGLLSRRWGQLWNHRHILKFDAENMFGAHTARTLLSYYRRNRRTCMEKNVFLTNKFVESVNSVLQQNQGSRVARIWVEFFLDKANSHHFDAWLRFAVESKTKIINLDLRRPYYIPFQAEEPYEFPCQLFAGHQGLAVEDLYISFCSLKPHIGFAGLKNLKSLHIVRLDVTDEGIKCLLSNCSTLESMSVIECPQLVALSISHPLSRLHFLRVMGCDGINKIEIEARNLTRFDYKGGWVDFKFIESSQLKSSHIIFFTDDSVGAMDFALIELSSKLPHLVELKLEIMDVSKVAYLPKYSINFTHLTGLCWVLHTKMSLLCLVSFLNAAPLLEILKLDFRNRVEEKPPRRLKKLWRKLPKQPRSCLKTVEIYQFYGDKWQTEIALYLLENTIDLETMMIKTRKSSDDDILEGAIKYLRRKYPTIIIL